LAAFGERAYDWAKEEVEMTVNLKVKLIPWDDREFVEAFDRAAASLAAEGRGFADPSGALELQRRLRADGYPNATCYCERTIEEALAQGAHCVVNRDGAPAPLGA
jgi:hypothetical protein